MRAIRIYEHGDANVLRLVDLPEPEPTPGTVVIRNHAIGVNYVDIQHRQGGYYPVTLPLIPGIEAAGVVDAIGEGVHQFKVGDRVAYAGYMGGNYAEKTCVPEAQLIPVPEDVDFQTAAAGLLQGMTAQCLTNDVYSVTQGDWVLVHAAAGGVGAFLVQMAKRQGGRVIGTVSSEKKVEYVRSLGADHIINHREEDFAQAVNRITEDKGVQVVYDAIGKATFEGSFASLARCGHMVVYGQTSGAIPLFDINLLSGLTGGTGRGSLSLTWAALSHYNAERQVMLARAQIVLELLRTKAVEVKVSQCLPLDEAAHAHQLLEDRDTIGKILLIP